MKKLALYLLCAVMLMSCAAAEMIYPNSVYFGIPEGPEGSAAIMADFPEDTIMVESVAFEDGDYIQSFLLPGGVSAQMLRYGAFTMTLAELADGEWPGHGEMVVLDLTGLDESLMEGVRFSYAQKGEKQDVVVYMLRAEARGQTLLMQLVFPAALGSEKIVEQAKAILESVQIQSLDVMEWG